MGNIETNEIQAIEYSFKKFKDVEVILKTTPYIDQLNPEELKRYMAWINVKYAEKVGE